MLEDVREKKGMYDARKSLMVPTLLRTLAVHRWMRLPREDAA